MNLLTIIVLLIILFFILNGYRRGFIRSLVSMMSIVVSIVLVSIVSPYVTDFLKAQTPVYDVVLEKCRESFGMEAMLEKVKEKSDTPSGAESSDISQKMSQGEAEIDLSGLSMLEQTELIEKLNLPSSLQQILEKNNNKSGYDHLNISSFEDYIPSFMANLIIQILSFVVTFLLVTILLRLALLALDILSRLPVLNGLNRVLGLGLGLIQGLLFVWIGFLIITVFSNMDFGKQLMSAIQESTLLTILYDQNIFLKLLTDVMSVIG